VRDTVSFSNRLTEKTNEELPHAMPMDLNRKFIPGIAAPSEREDRAWWFAFQGDKLLVHQAVAEARIPCLVEFTELGLRTLRQHYLGRWGGRHCYAVEVEEGPAPPSDMAFEGLRPLFDRLDEGLFGLAGLAAQIIEWDRTHQFCGRCGSQTEAMPRERAKSCRKCGLLHFPRLSPAVIVLVEHGPKLLLARSRRFRSGMYSVIAGFVEPGETLEQAVAREVWEETGLAIKDIRYFGSQPWPFPHSLMIGFTARYAGGEIKLDDDEIEDAGWYSAGNLPELPTKISIARKMIDWFLSRQCEVEQAGGSLGHETGDCGAGGRDRT
jgi:NAD+ diphosphatase